MTHDLAVKVCGLREIENIREVCALSPNYVGFIFVPSSRRFVGASPDRALFSAIPNGLKKVGVFQNAPLADVLSAIERFSLDCAQLHGDESAEYRGALKEALPDLTILQAVSVAEESDVRDLDTTGSDIVLFDSGRGGTGLPFDWNLLSCYRGSLPCMLAGGIGLEAVAPVKELRKIHPRIMGIDVNSAVESSPGMKDIRKLEMLLKEVRA